MRKGKPIAEEIILEGPRGPEPDSDVSVLDSLVADLSAEGFDVGASASKAGQIKFKAAGSGPAIEIVWLTILGKAAAGAAIGKVVALAIDWARKRLRQRWERTAKEGHITRPPTEIVTIYGPDRKPLKRSLLNIRKKKPLLRTSQRISGSSVGLDDIDCGAALCVTR